MPRSLFLSALTPALMQVDARVRPDVPRLEPYLKGTRW